MDPRMYSYRSDGFDDTDWGCAFRSFQNVLSHSGWKVPSMPWLLNAMRKHRGEWAEPAEFKRFIPGSVAALAGNGGKSWLKNTGPEAYERRFVRVTQLDQAIRAGASEFGWGFVVDDGISAFAVVPHKGGPMWVDPHTSAPKRVAFRRQLFKRKGWMVLAVPPNALGD